MEKSELQNAAEIFTELQERAGADEAQRGLYRGLRYLAQGMMSLDAKVDQLHGRVPRGD